MTSRDSLLSDEDRYFLRENLAAEGDPQEEDPQAREFYAAEAMITELDSPVWTRDEAVSWVRSMADARGLCVEVVFEQRFDQEALADGKGGTLFFPADHTYPSYRSDLRDGEYLASLVVHEFAHLVTVANHRGGEIQSHGPQYVRCYLDLLSTVMPTERTQEAMAFLGVQVPPRGAHEEGG